MNQPIAQVFSTLVLASHAGARSVMATLYDDNCCTHIRMDESRITYDTLWFTHQRDIMQKVPQISAS
jgi:hypothetical protein